MFLEIYSFYTELAENSEYVELFSTTDSESDVFGLKISSFVNLAVEKPLWMVIDCGKYGSDWLAISSCQKEFYHIIIITYTII